MHIAVLLTLAGMSDPTCANDADASAHQFLCLPAAGWRLGTSEFARCFVAEQFSCRIMSFVELNGYIAQT